MKAISVIVIACVSAVSQGYISIPHGCSNFSRSVNGKRDVSELDVGQSLQLPSTIFDTDELRHSVAKRFLLDILDIQRERVITAVLKSLPESQEVDHACRIRIDTTDAKDIAFIRAMAKRYKTCVVCDKTTPDNATCNQIGFCHSNSVCYRGYSDDRKYWPHSASLNKLYDKIHPKAAYHGCCNPSDSKCRSMRYLVKRGNTKLANYTTHTCSGIACNAGDIRVILNLVTKINRVDGGWSHWGHWGHCSATCGTGIKERHRSCTNPTPSGGGKNCLGSTYTIGYCPTKSHACPVNGGWGSWHSWGTCSVTCGTGDQSRVRYCSHPAPANGGKNCNGDSKQKRHCGHPCVVDGHWSGWHGWSQCSKSCSAGTRTRMRTCSNPSPANGGKSCTGSKSLTQKCDHGPCPEWSHWYYDACSVTCGNGTTSRLRHCSSGKDGDCGSGKAFESVNCNDRPCPVDGSWGTWGKWGSCTATCDEGQHKRSRSCNDPVPQNGGADCKGPTVEDAKCNIMDCPHWLPFKETSSCSVTCGKGFIQLKRNCSTGVPTDCKGSAFTEKTCVLDECL